MAKKGKNKKSLKDKMARSVTTENQKRSSYGYLKLPNGVPIYKAAPGTSNIRFDIMPYVVTDTKHPDKDVDFEIATKGELWYRRPFKIHRNVGTNNETIVCPTSFGQKCPICEARVKRISEGADKAELDTMKSSNRCLYVVIPKKSKEFEEKPHIWDFSQYNFEKLLREEIEEEPDNGCFSDLEGGLTLKVRFDSATVGKGKPYAESSRIDFLARDEDYDESILEDTPNLDEILTAKSYKEIENLWYELDAEEEEDGDGVEEKPKRKSKTSKKKPASEPEDAEDDEDEEVMKPKKKKSKKKPKPEPEPEEDEEEEEEEDEESTKAIQAKINKKKKAAIEKVTKKSSKNKCPFGHKFGKDCETSDDCDACDLWEDCSEAQEDE